MVLVMQDRALTSLHCGATMANPAEPTISISFEDHLASEIIHSERLRMAILAGLMGGLILALGLIYAVRGEQYLHTYLTPAAFAYIAAVIALLMGYELAIRQLLGRRLQQGTALPGALRYLNALVETSVPTIIMVLVAREIDPHYVLQSAAGFLYPIIIVLSTLRLDFRLSLFTGLVAAVQYVALSLAYLGPDDGAWAHTPFEFAPFYLAKGAMLALAGLAAGYVAHQIRRRIVNLHNGLLERQRVLSAFGQQVSPAIADELLKAGPDMATRRAVVCVMFMDIRGFTPLVEKMSPEQIIALQNIIFSEAAGTVNRHHGIINQFLGDGFMATFGAPIATGSDCANALAAARALVAGIGELSRAGRIPPIKIGIGLHTGDAVCGNVGSALRKQYSITGNVVILASRIEQLNKRFGSQILVSGEVLAAAGEEAGGEASLGPVQVQGRAAPIALYRLA